MPSGKTNRRAVARAFTLIELLLVVAIIGIVTAITMPTLVKSIRGNRLRAATRGVVMAGRYARSMALLHQVEMIVIFDLDAGRVTVRPAAARPAATPGLAAWEAGAAPAGGALAPEREAGEAATNVPGGATGNEEIERELDGVKIEYVEIGGGMRSASGQASAVYASNGRCTPYLVGLADEAGGVTTVEVDVLGSARTAGLRR